MLRTKSGTLVSDRSGNGFHGTLTGTPPPVLGMGNAGEGLDFSSTTTAYVALPSVPVDESPGAFNTVAMWFYRAGPSVDETLFFMPPGPGTAPPRYDLWLNTGNLGQPALCINSGVGDCWGYASPDLLDRWVHVVAIFGNGRTDTGTLFIDGSPVTMACRFGSCDQQRAAQNPVTLGASDDAYAWHGLLDEVQLFNRALHVSEVATLFACSPPG